VFEDLHAYIDSLHKMKSAVSGRAYPGHGPVLDNATAKITDYIKHRQQREDEVIRVLTYGTVDAAEAQKKSGEQQQASSSWTPIELVKVIYRDVPESLHLPASHGIVLILNKLENEGKVKHEGSSGKWSLNVRRPAL
jgi:glyoxylase-like metal-dependent hydrolase (beta-lactamase superfamily II)